MKNMKRIVSFALALLMLLSVAAMAVNAADRASVTEGEIYGRSGNYAVELEGSYAAPGTTVYVALCEYDKDDKVERAKLEGENSESRSLIANDKSLEVVRLRDDDGDYWYFAELKIKSISAKNYDSDDEYWYEGELSYTTEEDNDDTHYLEFQIGYEVGDSWSEVGASPMVLVIEDEDELSIEDESGRFKIEGEATRDMNVIVSVDTDTIDAIDDKFGDDADLAYYTCQGDFSRIKKGVVIIEADPGRYLYEYKDKQLYNLSDNYDKGDDCFYLEFESNAFELGTYVVSDRKLSGASSGTVTATSSSTTSTPNNTYVPINPSTGAAA